ncbi:MAG: NUDIX hydrolase [Bacteroidota bacterium]
MLNHSNQNKSPFTHKVRVRVCGILKENSKILLLKHEGIGRDGYLWSPPGGGVEFGDSMEETLKKEFLEETNLRISVDKYLFVNEFIDSQHHAIEHFFQVTRESGDLQLGMDPELSPSKQIITEVKFFNAEELDRLDSNAIHGSFLKSKTRDKIDDQRGLITFSD